MMEEPISQVASPSGDNFSGSGELSSATIVTLDERLLDITARHTLNVLRTPPTKKAKRVRFFRNGDKFYTGVVMAVTPERYRSFDSLASDLTRALVSSVTLPNGVRAIYTMDGRKVQSISDLEDGKCYVVSGQGEMFKKVEYSSSKVRRGSSLSGLPQSPAGTGRQINAIPLCVKARIVTLIRHGTKPRKVVRLLLNKRNAPSLEHALEAITEAVKLDTGAVRKVYTLSGQQVNSLEQFFENDEIFLAYGPEKPNQDDFELDFEESKSVQSFRRCPGNSKRNPEFFRTEFGPMPPMPRKSGKKALTTPQVRTPSPSAIVLPQSLRSQYEVGHIIGEGNFAVVRHCVHKLTDAEYALKIVDKSKCQGKEKMLASEVAILSQVCHPNIISLIAEQETPDQRFLVMELVKGGDLFDAIAAMTKFSEAEASVMIGHLTSALAYLHSQHIVHRDVKPENLLVEMDGSHIRCLKLGDFGLAEVVRKPLYTVCGTPTYVAPEILAESGYGLKIDVWAAGVILYILLCGFPPFVSPENEQEELFERILSGQYEFTSPYWDTISDSAKQLISNMLQAQPELRFSAEDVLDHPWLAQSFLGGEQTAATTPTNTAEQHWDQQRKPIRLATFEFDYKKQRMHGDTDDETADLDNLKTSIRNRWNDSPSMENANFIHQTEENQNSAVVGRDEIDFANGNQSEEEPVSLSADCLQDIHTLSQSMHNLINDLNETRERRQRCRSPHSTDSSRNSPVTNVNLHTQKDNCNAGSPVRQRGSWAHASAEISPSMNRTNGNSFPGSYDDGPTTPKSSDVQMNRNHETPKSCRSNVNRQRYRRKQFCEISTAFNNVESSFDSNDMSYCETSCRIMSSSSESLTGSSSNDIETSDSFVNIQFAQLASGQKSSSTQSMESTDSFENIRFSSQVLKDVCVTDPSKNDCSETINQRSYRKEDKSNDTLSQTRLTSETHASKVPRSLNIITSNTKKMSIQNTRKQQDVPKCSKNETVKFRDDKCTSARNSVDARNAAKSKRFSCFPAYSDKKMLDVSDKSVYAVVKNGRKFSSTDELRDEKQKQNVKAKRFSLYYTPQPLRKTYEAEIKAGKNTCKNLSTSNNDRQSVTKVTDVNKRKEETSGCDDKRNIRNRKSMIDGSTAASRSKVNKQNVHNRNNIVNTNLNPGRTK